MGALAESEGHSVLHWGPLSSTIATAASHSQLLMRMHPLSSADAPLLPPCSASAAAAAAFFLLLLLHCMHPYLAAALLLYASPAMPCMAMPSCLMTQRIFHVLPGFRLHVQACHARCSRAGHWCVLSLKGYHARAPLAYLANSFPFFLSVDSEATTVRFSIPVSCCLLLSQH